MKTSSICLLAATALAGAATAFATLPRPTAAAATDPALSVPPKAIAAGNAYWKSLGVKPPAGGFILAHPWSPPWSGRSLVVPMEWIRQARDELVRHMRSDQPESVNAAALRKDLPILRTVLEKNYSGWETAAKHGWNWDTWFAGWDNMLAGYGTRKISGDKAFAPWFALERFQIDSHSGPAIPTYYKSHEAYSRSALLAQAPSGTCSRLQTSDGAWHDLSASDPAQQPHAIERWHGDALQPASYVVYPSPLGTAKDVVCGGQTIATKPFWTPYADPSAKSPLAESVASLSGGQQGLTLYHTLAPGIGYLRLAAFVDAGNEAFTKLLPKLPASAGHEKLLIVDLRGNGGGNAPIDLMSRWIPLDRIDDGITRTAKRSCLFPGLWFNLGQMLALQVKPPVTDGFRQTMAAYSEGLDAPASADCPTSFKTTRGKWNYTDQHFVRHWQGAHPRLLVLVDNMCGSDCEAMTWYLAQIPGTVVAGRNTFGLIGFTQPGRLLLPHTRILFAVATSYTDAYGDGRSGNAYGLDVDVVLPAEADWSAASILALAKTLAPVK